LLGGYLVEHVSWRWAFGINVPFAIVSMLLAARFVPESHSTKAAGRLDTGGTVLIAGALGCLTYGTTAAGSHGWTFTPWAFTVAGALLLAGFVWFESWTRDPMVELRLFANRVFVGSNIMTFTTYGALGAVLFLYIIDLQVVGGYGPLAAAVATLPITVLLLFGSPRSGALATRIGPRMQMTAGPVLVAAGFALTARLDRHHHHYLTDVLPGVVVFGIGLTLLVAPLTATVMAAADADDVGIASGVNNAVARSASLLAVAILPPLAGLTGNRYQVPASMEHSYRVVVAICIVVLLAGAVAVLLTVPRGSTVPADFATEDESNVA
jgi:MFS family permease